MTVLGIATLKAILQDVGYPTDMLTGTLLFPSSASVSSSRTHFAQFYYVPFQQSSVTREDCADAILSSLLEQLSLQGAWIPREEMSLAHVRLDPDQVRHEIYEGIEQAGVSITRCVERAIARDYDVVGFSCSFETQIPAALAIAKRLKAVKPEMAIVFGGSACFGEPASELARCYPSIDAVCHTEADGVVVPIMDAFCELGCPPRGTKARAALDRRLSSVAGLAFLDSEGQVRRTASPPLLFELDSLPIPDYSDFFAQYEASFPSGPPELHYETSRGCWWGQKSLCSFCGLNGEGLAYRRKSPDRVVEEILFLHERYPYHRKLSATDNILAVEYLDTVMPRLAKIQPSLDRKLQLWFEIKSNLKRGHIKALAEAGVVALQPGIESLSDRILTLMAKGNTALRQVQTLKWMAEYSIDPAYHLLVRNPGEVADDYRQQLELMPYVEHLPPGKVGSIELQRFSPYHLTPEKYDIKNVRARPYYRFAYRAEGVDVERLAYRFNYDHDTIDDPELVRWRRNFIVQTLDWYRCWRPHLLFYRDFGTHLEVDDERGVFPARYRVEGAVEAIFKCLDSVRPRRSLRNHLPALDPDVVDCATTTWEWRRWVYHDRRIDRLLCVVPERHDVEAAPARDAAHELATGLSPSGGELLDQA